MNFIRRNPDFRTISKCIRFYSLGKKNHYEVLNLRKNCSEKDIKEAFIQMSKEYHPDKNKDKRAQDKFVRIVEAYNVLSKAGSRAQYDSLIEVDAYGGSSYVYRPHVPYNLRKNPQYSYYYENKRTSSEEGKKKSEYQNEKDSYYGMVGIKKMPHSAIILLCAAVATFGLVIQMFVIRESFVIHRKQAQERSKMIAEELDKVRSAAKQNGNETQSRLLMDKIVSAANPTVATASLGQALANEKKETETDLTEFGIGELNNDILATPVDEMKVTYELLRKIRSYFT